MAELTKQGIIDDAHDKWVAAHPGQKALRTGADREPTTATVVPDSHVGLTLDGLNRVKAQMDLIFKSPEHRRKMMMGDWYDDFPPRLDEKQVVRVTADCVLSAMLKEMPLARLYEQWEQRKHTVPAHYDKIKKERIVATPYGVYGVTDDAVWQSHPDLEIGAFNEALAILRQRMQDEITKLMLDGGIDAPASA